jgi:hypothetical protein
MIMPQQFFHNNYMQAVQPITQSITNAAVTAGSTVADLSQARRVNKRAEINNNMNQQAYNQLFDFFGSVDGLNVDWKRLSPNDNEPSAAYLDRLQKQELPAIMDQLDRMGFDPNELAQATKIPGVTMETLVKLRDKRLAQRLISPDQAGAQADIMAGKMTPDEINRRRGTNIGQEDYEKIAGLGAPITVPKTQNEQGSYLPARTDMPAVRVAAAADKPLTPQQAQAGPLKEGASFETARQIYQGMSPEGQKAYEPLMTAIMNREAAKIAKQPEQTPVGFYTGMQEKNLQLTPESTATGKALEADRLFNWKKLNAEEMLEYKKKYAAVRSKEQDNSLLKALLQYDMFSKRMQKDYGTEGEAAQKYLFGLIKQREDLDAQLSAAGSYIPGVSKGPEPDPSSIMDQMRNLDNEIDRIRFSLPHFNEMVEEFRNKAPNIMWPQVKQPGFDVSPGSPTPPPAPAQPGTEDFEAQARKWLAAHGNANPTYDQVLKVVSRLKLKTKG